MRFGLVEDDWSVGRMGRGLHGREEPRRAWGKLGTGYMGQG